MKKLLLYFLLLLTINVSGQGIVGVIASSGGSGATYGTELVTDGVFAAGTNWELSTGVTVAGGVCVMANPYSYATLLYQIIDIQQGKTYKIEFDITSYTSGQLRVLLGDTDNGNYNDIDYTGTGHVNIELFYNNTLAPTEITFYSWDTPANMSIDNVSVKEVL